MFWISRQDLYDLILLREQKKQHVDLYVYNTVSDEVRLVQLVPNAAWGGGGAVGCELAYGYWHRISFKAKNAPPPTTAVVGTPVRHTTPVASGTPELTLGGPGPGGAPAMDSPKRVIECVPWGVIIFFWSWDGALLCWSRGGFFCYNFLMGGILLP